MTESSNSSPTSPIQSPLTQVKARSLAELFEAHPDTLTDEDIDRMVKDLRENRQHFKMAKQARVKSAPIPEGSVDDILSLIGLDKGKLPGKKP